MEVLTEIFKQTDPVEQILVFNNLTNCKRESSTLEEIVSLLTQFYPECCKNNDFGFIIFEWIMNLYDGKLGNELLLETVLTEACRLNNSRLAKYLLQYGVRNFVENEKIRKLTSKQNINSSTALLHCVDNYNLDLVKQMTELNVRDDSALIRALCLGKHSVAEYLVQNGYEFPKKIEYEMLKNSYVFFTNRDWKATTALAEASAKANDVNILSVLYTKENSRNPSYTPVFIFDNMRVACIYNSFDAVKWLDEKLDEHKIPEMMLETSLVDCMKNASRKNSVAIVEYLIQKYLRFAKKHVEYIRHEAMKNTYSELAKRIDELTKE